MILQGPAAVLSSLGRFSTGGITIPIKSSKSITDRLRYRDARTKEMYDIFKWQDDHLQDTGRKVTEDNIQLHKSHNITSSDELKSEKAGTVDLSELQSTIL